MLREQRLTEFLLSVWSITGLQPQPTLPWESNTALTGDLQTWRRRGSSPTATPEAHKEELLHLPYYKTTKLAWLLLVKSWIKARACCMLGKSLSHPSSSAHFRQRTLQLSAAQPKGLLNACSHRNIVETQGLNCWKPC